MFSPANQIARNKHNEEELELLYNKDNELTLSLPTPSKNQYLSANHVLLIFFFYYLFILLFKEVPHVIYHEKGILSLNILL